MNVLLEIVRQSLATLWAHKLRSFLTMFGIAWGVGSLLLLVGLGEGFRSGQVRNLVTLGQDIMFVFPGRIPAVSGSLQSGQTYRFTYEDYLAIRNEVHTLRALSPVINREDIRAVSEYGCNNGTNARIFVPVETMRNLFPLKEQNSESALSFINYRPLNKAEHLRTKEEVHQIIARRHGFDPKLGDAFEDWDTIENSQRVDKIFDAMDYFLGVVGFVTLALGAIGIVNIMLVSVAERTREIGLRKALGATYRAIMTQFFIEGAFLTAFSGGIGLAITGAFVTALAMLPAPEGFDTPRIVPLSAIGAVLALALAGLTAGRS